MKSSPRRAVSRLRIIAAVALFATLAFIPPIAPVRAQSGLYPGAVGLVANTGAEPVLLREAPSFEAAVLSTVPAGATTDVLDGPVAGDDGTPWYGVSYGGMTGYIVAGYLVDSGQTATSEAAPVELAQDAAPAELAPEEAPLETAP